MKSNDDDKIAKLHGRCSRNSFLLGMVHGELSGIANGDPEEAAMKSRLLYYKLNKLIGQWFYKDEKEMKDE